LNTHAELSIGNKIIPTEKDGGHYPTWNCIGSTDVSLEKDLAFETDIKVTLKTKKEKTDSVFSSML